MMQIGALRSVFYKGAECFYIAGTFSASLMGVLLSIDSEASEYLAAHPIQKGILEFVQGWSVPILALICFFTAICMIVKSFSDPWAVKNLQIILDGYRERCFGEFATDPQDHHRVTLFKRKLIWFGDRYNWKKLPVGQNKPYGTYLVPVLRSGSLSKNSNARFFICDIGDRCEGLPGRSWAMQQNVAKPQLPDLSRIKSVARYNNTIINRYCAQSGCSRRMVESYILSDRSLPRSIAVAPVMVQDKIWGVVVVDSRRPDGVSLDSVSNYRLTISIIGQLLERA